LQRNKLKIPEKFNPFTDRTARDIRNTLSESFAAALAEMDAAGYLMAARKWRSQQLAVPYAHCLSFIANPETLLDKLKNCDPVPPQLEIVSIQD
jgi:hypothetical protein